MKSPLKSASLDSLGVLRARGADAVSFLQGQLSNDVAMLSASRALLAGYHNPQGRTIALLRLIEHGPGDVLALLPRELAAPVAARLAKFVLRSKVKVTDDSAAWRIFGLSAEAAAAEDAARALGVPDEVNAVSARDAARIVRIGSHPLRALLVQPAGDAPALAGVVPVDEAAWHAAGVAAAEPQVFAATSEAFVAQMLNLDVLGAVAFDKGCYTGQEVIARAHYRGRVKRRLQRFLSRGPAQLAPGDSGTLADGRSVKVVDAVQHPDGRCEFLAVAGAATEEDAAAPATGDAAPIEAEALPLPYALPQ
ncbi:MAG: folate-binding protein YgfZ [Proteobacteria bacterium]|nr:folate-binding protein YgfZ [Pseudomonadota bacterium]